MPLSEIHAPYSKSDKSECCLKCVGAVVNSKDCIHYASRKTFKNKSLQSESNIIIETLWKETQQLMEKSEQLIHLMTHVCTSKLSGVFRADAFSRQQPKCSSLTGCENINTCSAKNFVSGRETEAKSEVNSHRCGVGVKRFLRSRPNKNHWDRAQRPWKLPVEGDGGTGTGPPLSKFSKRKHSSPNAPSWTKPSLRPSFNTTVVAFLLLVASLVGVAESCSSRSTPKPRPSSPTFRPNVTFPTYACPPAYAAWFCLNGATCFTVKIQDAILYNCECADGYMGPRCEFKDLDGSYSPGNLEKASIAGGACAAIVLVFLVLFAMYVFMHKDREKRRTLGNPYDDRRPLSVQKSSDFICTITPLHEGYSKQGFAIREEADITKVHHPAELRAKTSKDIFIVAGIDHVCVCTCNQRDVSSTHATCVNHSHKVVPKNVPKYV